jgi:hypothetical protein
MANSVLQSRQGPLWPLGSLAPTPGTPVNMMSLVDPTLVNAPDKVTPGTVGANEYTVRAQQIIIQGMKSNGGNGLTNNTGNVYVILKGKGSNNRTDTGCIVLTVPAGQTGVIASAPMVMNVFNPYLLWIDCDTVGDAAQVTLIIQ